MRNYYLGIRLMAMVVCVGILLSLGTVVWAQTPEEVTAGKMAYLVDRLKAYYRAHNYTYPQSLEQLRDAGYAVDEQIKDAFNPPNYFVLDAFFYRVISKGPDGQLNAPVPGINWGKQGICNSGVDSNWMSNPGAGETYPTVNYTVTEFPDSNPFNAPELKYGYSNHDDIICYYRRPGRFAYLNNEGGVTKTHLAYEDGSRFQIVELPPSVTIRVQRIPGT